MLPLLRELGHLKRIRSAGRRGSVASRLFRSAWADLVSGEPIEAVALATTARALAAARLADLDPALLARLGLSVEEAAGIQRDGFDDVAGCVAQPLRSQLRAALASGAEARGSPLPGFVEALDEQPRAGITCPGRPRIVLQPPESHAEHCLAVAIYGVVLSPCYGADPGTVFLAALAHHLHNAAMPDGGFTGEMLLGPHLERAIWNATEAALGELSPHLRAVVEEARTILADADSPEGRAFHAADVIDRVLEVEQHLVGARLTMGDVLGEMALVHDGPVKPFHDRVLREMELA